MDPVTYNTTTSVDTGAFGLFFGAYSIFWLVVAILTIVGVWKTFAKAGRPGWAAIIPIYNIIVMLQVAGRPIWWVILYLIPFVNFVISIIVALDLAKKFGKGAAFGLIALWLFAPIGFLILGFDQSQYQGSASQAV